MKSKVLLIFMATAFFSLVQPTFGSISGHGLPNIADNAIIGAWVLCNDPDHGKPNTNYFYSEGYGLMVPEEGSKIPFLFWVFNGEVKALANVHGALVDLSFSLKTNANPDKTVLIFTSPKPEHRSTYVRKGTERENSCTAGHVSPNK